MMEVQAHDRVLTELDHARLASLSAAASRDARNSIPGLDDLLDGAEIVSPQGVAADIVTMYSQVRLRTCDDGLEREVTLCYPADADPRLGLVSVLSPLGLGLLGRTAGTAVRWQCPDGRERTAEVDAVLFQPEATGDYVT